VIYTGTVKTIKYRGIFWAVHIARIFVRKSLRKYPIGRLEEIRDQHYDEI
jgi:hypothetical protein